MPPDVNASLVAAAYVSGEIAEDFGASPRIKLLAQMGGGVLAAAASYLAPQYPWFTQVGEAGIVAGLVAAGMVHGPALLTAVQARVARPAPVPAPADHPTTV